MADVIFDNAKPPSQQEMVRMELMFDLNKWDRCTEESGADIARSKAKILIETLKKQFDLTTK